MRLRSEVIVEDKPTVLDRMSQMVGVSFNTLTGIGDGAENEEIRKAARKVLVNVLKRMDKLADQNFDFGDRDGDI